MNNKSLVTLKGIGDKTAELFKKLGIFCVDDLIRYYPYKFDKYEELIDIDSIKENMKIAVYATPVKILKTVNAGKLKITSTVIGDGTGTIDVVWYNMPYLSRSLNLSEKFVFSGITVLKRGRLILEHPLVYNKQDYDKLQGNLKPIYALTKGISNKTIEKAVTQALLNYQFEEDYLVSEIIDKYALIGRDQAVRLIHNPTCFDQLKLARYRLAFDEFFIFLYNIRYLKKINNSIKSKYVFKDKDYSKALIESLPFKLTDSQLKVINEIENDIKSSKVMNRLIQGDVGSGKTIIALCALYDAYKNGFQGVIMVPTEVLAKQHYRTLMSFLQNISDKPNVLMLTGSMSKGEKDNAKDMIRTHKADIIIGTHAIIQSDVVFEKLAITVTDEQHRFGVLQRESLSEKGGKPHILVMSATPIPRTLAIILYGDLDISVVDTKPVGRLPIKNCIITKRERKSAYKHIMRELESGHQAYIICSMVEENETIEAEDVTEYTKRLKLLFPDKIKIEYLHGKMHDKQKDDIMCRFSMGQIDILVSTTVVEVGVDVPNATVMMIENAERFGLATLHQLRGRVGRGIDQSYCIFVRTSNSETAKRRLEIVNNSNDGFYIAAEDLKLRGPGDILGRIQSGDMTFGIADIYNDSDALRNAYDACTDIIEDVIHISDDDKNMIVDRINKYGKQFIENPNI